MNSTKLLPYLNITYHRIDIKYKNGNQGICKHPQVREEAFNQDIFVYIYILEMNTPKILVYRSTNNIA